MTCSIAAVLKSDGVALRKIVQCVPANSAMISPADVAGKRAYLGLIGGAAVSQFDAVEGVAFATALDEGNAFSYVQTEPAWWPFFGGPAVRVRDPPRKWVLQSGGGHWPMGAWLRPQYRRLPMGFSHAAHLLM